MEKKTYDLNISEKYVPSWGAWEVGREILSNAMDADATGYKVQTVSADHIRVTTRTMPTLAQIKFLGGGTKSQSSATIGCFGEGIKLAAMVSHRLGGSMTVRFDKFLVEYELREDADLGARCALMHVTDAGEYFDGMAVDVLVEGISRAVSGRFLSVRVPGFVEKRDESKLTIYNKSVFVAERDAKSLYDWNLNTTVNRDRNVVDFWNIGCEVTSLMEEKMDVHFAKQLLQAGPDTFEVECLQKFSMWTGERTAAMLVQAMKEKYGADIVIAGRDAKANEIARRKGLTVVIVDQGIVSAVQKLEKGKRMPLAAEVVSHLDSMVVDYEKKYDMSDLNAVMEAIDVFAEVFVFESAGPLLGKAEFKDGMRRVYLASCLFGPGRSSERLGTFVHELAHVESQAGDAEMDFEDSLTKLAGKLARAVVKTGGVS